MDRDEALKVLGGGVDGVAEWYRRRGEGEEIPNLSGAEMSRGSSIRDLSHRKPNAQGQSRSATQQAKSFLTDERANAMDRTGVGRPHVATPTLFRVLRKRCRSFRPEPVITKTADQATPD